MKYFYLLLLLSLTTIRLGAQLNFTLNGDAELIANQGECFKLTNEEQSSAGSLWYDLLINLNQNFELLIEINLGTIDGNGADGIAFVLQPINTGLGSIGGGLGFEGISPSLGLEFDTYTNQNTANDPTYDHMALMQDGVLDHNLPTNLAGPMQIVNGNDNVEDGQYHSLKITWFADEKKFVVIVDCEVRMNLTLDIVEEIFNGNPMVYWGFTGSTGQSYNEQSVCFDYISFYQFLSDYNYCTPTLTEVELLGGVSYLWSSTPNDNSIIDATSASQSLMPSVSTNYQINITDACGEVSFRTFDIIISNLIASYEILELDCATSTADIAIQTTGGIAPVLISIDGSLPSGSLIYTDIPLGNHQIIITDALGCEASLDLLVEIETLPEITVQTQNSDCANSANGTAELIINGSASGLTIEWLNNGVLGSSTSISDLAPGDYEVVITNSANCENTLPFTIGVNAEITLNISGVNTTCGLSNGAATLTIEGGIAPYTIAWDNGQGNATTIENLNAGTYTVTVNDASNCTVTATIDIESSDSEEVVVNPSTVTIAADESVALNASNGANYAWSPTTNLSCSDCATPIANPITTTTYTVSSTDIGGCQSAASVTVIVNNQSDIYIPSAFSPNGDGTNDAWRVMTANIVTLNMKIYNRWGKMVYEGDGLDTAWNGLYNQTQQDIGVYVYLITAVDLQGKEVIKKGNITLIR